MKQARMLVLSSDSEGLGNVVIEALILGTPVASTRCPGGIPEILTARWQKGLQTSIALRWLRRCKAFTLIRRLLSRLRWKNSAWRQSVSNTAS
jgi:glycosyltransferase involved in cell wall biosynthesis